MARASKREITSEYAESPLPDARLNSRLFKIAKAVEARPDAGFPQVFSTESELEAFYRFVGNERVSWEQVLAPHLEATVDRAAPHETILVAHDTSEFRFGGKRDREGLTRGRTGSKGQPGPRAKQGFLGHFALAITADDHHHPLGALGLFPWAREEETPTRRRKQSGEHDPTDPSEQDRWLDLIDEVELRVGDVTEVLHVLDSEADDYHLLSALAGQQSRFVVRKTYDRVVITEAGKTQRLREFVATLPVKYTETIQVSARQSLSGKPRRRDASRDERQAVVAVSASSTTLRRPQNQSKDLPKSLAVNIVAARELNPPDDAEPVDWILITTEPVETKKQIKQVINHYRGRWVIEEFFKSIKSGCAYEKRQLESLETLLVALAIFVPIAWQILNLRTMCRSMPNEPASRCFSKRQLTILVLAGRDLGRNLTVREALLAVARLGGHLKRNGEPGWQVLGRGYLELLALERGFLLAQKM
jgi:Transposase DNA-binding/Transposase DDE domain